MRQFLAGKWVLPLAFGAACALAGFATVTLHAIGGLGLVSCAVVCLLFAVIGLADLRSAFLFTFAFSLFQPLVTRMLFYIDFPEAASESMLHYRDPLTTTVSLLLICCACLALLPALTGKRDANAPGASSEAASYTLQYATDPAFADATTVAGLVALTYTVPDGASLAWGTYYWRVEAVDVVDHHSGYQAHPLRFGLFKPGDQNGDESITASDIIYLVNYTFKAGPAPCNVGNLIAAGTWSCP